MVTDTDSTDTDNTDNTDKDKNWRKRYAQARQGTGLDVLINDENVYVRAEVAEQRYGLDILINDEDSYVRWVAGCVQGCVQAFDERQTL